MGKKTFVAQSQGVVCKFIRPMVVTIVKGGFNTVGVSHVNQMYTIRNLQKYFLFIVAAAIFFSVGSASAVAKPLQGDDLLLDTYQRNKARLETNSFGIPLFLESFERDDKVHVDVYGIFDHPFGSVVSVLKIQANWCDI